MKILLIMLGALFLANEVSASPVAEGLDRIEVYATGIKQYYEAGIDADIPPLARACYNLYYAHAAGYKALKDDQTFDFSSGIIMDNPSGLSLGILGRGFMLVKAPHQNQVYGLRCIRLMCNERGELISSKGFVVLGESYENNGFSERNEISPSKLSPIKITGNLKNIFISPEGYLFADKTPLSRPLARLYMFNEEDFTNGNGILFSFNRDNVKAYAPNHNQVGRFAMNIVELSNVNRHLESFRYGQTARNIKKKREIIETVDFMQYPLQQLKSKQRRIHKAEN